MATLIFIILEAALLYLVLLSGGGLGLAYAGIMLSGYLMITGVTHAAGGNSSSALRISQICDF
jgi:hypothetical protein